MNEKTLTRDNTPTPGPAPKRVVVTGASTGIGAATVRELRDAGWAVVAVARREERLADLARETGCEYYAADLTNESEVAAMTDYALAGGPVDSVVNNAGGALGVETIADADPSKWRAMFERNVMTALLVTRAFLPHLRARGGDVLLVTSTAAYSTYPGGGGYVAAKHAERIVGETLRQELVGEPVRVIEMAPGLVKTEEFALTRLGSKEAAEAVYAGVENPLTSHDVAQAIWWALQLPAHVNIDRMTIRPVAQATNTLLARTDPKK